MKSLVFDSGPIISLTTTNLLWILERLKHKYNIDFFIVDKVKKELVDRPLHIRRFEFEAVQVMKLIENGILKIIDDEDIKNFGAELCDMANHVVKVYDNYVEIVHPAEMEALALAIKRNSNLFVIDERTTRLLIEDIESLKRLMKIRLNKDVIVDLDMYKKFKSIVKNIKMVRSTEIVAVAYELGLLNDLIPKINQGRNILIKSMLWGIKIHGCAISRREIDKIIDIEKQKVNI